MIEHVVGSFLDPRLQGRRVSVSPLVVLVSLLFWARIWGFAGAFLAVPLTLSVMIVAAHAVPVRPLGLLLRETDFAGLDRMASRRGDRD